MTVSPAMLARVDQESEAVLLRLYRLSPRARAVLARAFGTLIVPGLRADGGILGVAYGRGVLIEAGGERTYYNVIAGPPGPYSAWTTSPSSCSFRHRTRCRRSWPRRAGWRARTAPSRSWTSRP